MHETTAQLLSESEVSEIEATNKTYRIDWRYPNHREHVDALIRDWRVLKTDLKYRCEGEPQPSLNDMMNGED